MLISQKQKVLIPSLREKIRYIGFEIIVKKQDAEKVAKKISKTDVKKAMLKAVKNYLGIKNSAQAGTMFVSNTYKNSKSRIRGVLKVNRKYIDDVKASMMFIKEINDIPLIIKCPVTSGVINKVIKKLD